MCGAAVIGLALVFFFLLFFLLTADLRVGFTKCGMAVYSPLRLFLFVKQQGVQRLKASVRGVSLE